ncbi:hypothetical protein [Mycobacterium marinum]|uniref:hypothetical protein n=1 Tax=Mycobacterium marinum TaxID=1781 RepID=UPI00113FC519|nr:hypothetical protein [Mycobacterium marinum]
MDVVNPFREVTLRLPAGVFGGDPRGLIQHLGLVGRHLGDDRWAVRSIEDKSSIRIYDLADETGLAHRFDHLSHVPEPAESFADDPELDKRFYELQSQILERLQARDPAALFHLIQSNIVRAHSSRTDLIAPVKDGYDGIGQMPMGDTGEPAFPNRSAHLLVATDLLIRRVRLPAIIFRFDQDPDALETITGQQKDSTKGGVFSSSADSYNEIISLVRYLGPLLGCLSPRFWCLPTTIPPATILFNLGSHINGFRQSPMELMQLIPTRARRERIPPTQLTRHSAPQAINWWAMRLNQMFGYLSDPTTFRDAEGNYAAHEHHHWLLTFDQVFGLMTSLQCAGRDFTAQRALMNNLLDVFGDRILGLDFVDKLCSLQFAREKADEVRGKMPPQAAALLMPAADRAVAALEDAQDGFFIQRQRGDAEVRLRMPDGRWESRNPAKAVALLLKLHRNATHGFGQRKGKREKAKAELNASLLVHHHGQMPADIVLLPYLYLLDVLCNPDRIREMIVRNVTKPS